MYTIRCPCILELGSSTLAGVEDVFDEILHVDMEERRPGNGPVGRHDGLWSGQVGRRVSCGRSIRCDV